VTCTAVAYRSRRARESTIASRTEDLLKLHDRSLKRSSAKSIARVMGFSMTRPQNYCRLRDSFGTRLPRLRPNQASGSPRLVFTFFQGRDGGSACRRGIVGETYFLLGRAVERAKVKQRRKIVNPKKQSLATAPNLSAASHSFYWQSFSAWRPPRTILRALTTAVRRQIPRRPREVIGITTLIEQPSKSVGTCVRLKGSLRMWRYKRARLTL